MNKIAPDQSSSKKRRRNSFFKFLALLFAAYIVSFIPVLHWPLKWMETFFHEISHGLAALITGGKILKIEINWDGSGLCTTLGGVRFWVVFMGYAGASLWGGFIYLLSSKIRSDYAFISGIIVALFIVLCAIFWARDVVTFFILGIMLIPFILVYYSKKIWIEKYFMQFAGLYILLNSLKSPTYLLGGLDGGDGVTLQELTGLPEIIWIGIWCLLAILILWYIRKMRYSV